MRILLYCFLATSMATGCSKIETVENRNEQGVLLERYERKKDNLDKHGKYASFFPNGQVHEVRHYKNNLLNGESRVYFENGQIDYVENYKEGQYDGLYQKYFESGQLSNEGQYKNNQMSGIWKRWYPNGNLREEVSFKANNENGPFTEYHQNGQIKAKGQYLNGDNEQGELLLYDENGQLTEKMICEYGVCATIWRKGEGDIKADLERIKKLAELKKRGMEN